MIINEKQGLNITKLANVPNGEVILVRDELWMTTDEYFNSDTDRYRKCVKLSTGHADIFLKSEEVKILDAELVVIK